ncbi:hypothetical protein JMJ78_0000990, partial [Colletotrichum scovillei]
MQNRLLGLSSDTEIGRVLVCSCRNQLCRAWRPCYQRIRHVVAKSFRATENLLMGHMNGR